jgi:hypothetical protein
VSTAAAPKHRFVGPYREFDTLEELCDFAAEQVKSGRAVAVAFNLTSDEQVSVVRDRMAERHPGVQYELPWQGLKT